jgi:membrane protease YdiL (CAAX protease family)
MKMVNCPKCGKKTPFSNYCGFCGEKIVHNLTCNECGNLISIDIAECPKCFTPLQEKASFPQVITDPWYFQYLQPFKSSLTIILLLSSYYILQLALGLVITIFIPPSATEDLQILNSLNLIIVILSNLIFLNILIRKFPRPKVINRESRKSIYAIKSVIILFFFSILFLEISLVVFEVFLDFFSVPPVRTSPYDEYFSSTLNSFLFALLVTVIAPIFEEFLFRRHVLSYLEEIVQSKPILVFIGGIVFSLNHLPADLINGSLRYTIEHLYVVLFLGIILGVIFYRYGLLYSILLHSLWNTFSFLMQIEQDFPEIIFVFNFALIFGLFIIFLSLVFFIYNFRENIHSLRRNLVGNLRLDTDRISLFQNVVLLISYEILISLLLSIEQNIVSVAIFLSIQVLGIILGILVIEKNQKRTGIQKEEN